MHLSSKNRGRKLIVAIDGPAGSGKSTVSKRIAKKLGLLYLDTGAMYRAITLKAIRQDINLEDGAGLTKLAQSTNIDLKEEDSRLNVFLDGENVAGLIRTPELTNKVKYAARVPGVRKEMVRLQRAIGKLHGAVLEGRDIGTVVFPDADYKFYLDADVDVRVRRRHKELAELGMSVNEVEIKKDVVVRDESDMKRRFGALKKAEDAIYIDTTNLTVDEVVERALSYIKIK